MQLTTLTTTIITLLATAGITTAIAVEKRIPIIAGFTLSTSPTCPIPSSSGPGLITSRVDIAYGSACGQCVSLANPPYPPTPWTVISNTYVEPRCTVTLFQTFDCSDDGAVTGPNCWTPDGGIKGYKVACPWWPADVSGPGFKPCSGA